MENEAESAISSLNQIAIFFKGLLNEQTINAVISQKVIKSY